MKNFSLRDILLDCQVEQLQLAMLKLETNKPGRRFTLSSPYLLFNILETTFCEN